jgi:hypothetical protein
MNILSIILALALSVPVGASLMIFGGLVLEYVLGTLIEAGQDLEEDPAKRTWLYAGLALFGILVLCVVLACVGGALLLYFNGLDL